MSSGPCKTRPGFWVRGFVFAGICFLGSTPLPAQQGAGDSNNPSEARANLRIGVLLSQQGRLDSSLVYLRRARAMNPTDTEIRLMEALVMAWDRRYTAALVQYDSLLAEDPGLREAVLGRARTLAWSGRLDEAQSAYRQMITRDSADREALLGTAQTSAWKGDLARAEQEYGRLLARDSGDIDARVGLGYVYFWQGHAGAAGRQAGYALMVDSTHMAGRELQKAVRAAHRSTVESSANWSKDSDQNTSFWQTLAAAAPLSSGVGMLASVNALETSDPIRDATRIGAEAGLSLTTGPVQLVGAAGARRLTPDIAPPRTTPTYRAGLSYRPVPRLGFNLGYSRSPFDEIATLIERELDMESLEGGVDIKPSTGLTVYGGGGALWLSDGNTRTNFAGGLNQKIGRKLLLGVFGRTLSYQQQGAGYFSPDRFSVLEGVAGYVQESRGWTASLSGGLGAQQVGERGAVQTEWHVDGRAGRRWDSGNQIEVFGLITNSAVSSTTGAFRYGSAGLKVRLGL